MNPEEHYNKTASIEDDKILDRCLSEADNFDDFVRLLDHEGLQIYLDNALDYWHEYNSDK